MFSSQVRTYTTRQWPRCAGSSHTKRGRLATDVSSGQIFLRKKKNCNIIYDEENQFSTCLEMGTGGEGYREIIGYRDYEEAQGNFHGCGYVRYLDYGDDFTSVNAPNCTY